MQLYRLVIISSDKFETSSATEDFGENTHDEYIVTRKIAIGRSRIVACNGKHYTSNSATQYCWCLVKWTGSVIWVVRY